MEVFLVASARTPFAARNGALAGWHPVDLLSAAVGDLATQTGVDAVDFAVGATSSPIGEAALNVMRNSLLGAGLPEQIPAATIDTGGLVALDLAAAMLRSGRSDVAVVGAVDSSTRVPPGASSGTAVGKPFGRLVHDRYEAEAGLLPPGLVAEKLALRHGIGAAEVAAYVTASTRRAQGTEAAVLRLERRNERGKPAPGTVENDEWRVLPEEVEAMFVRGGVINAASFRSDGDGAVALLLCSERALKRFEGTRARVVATDASGAPLLTGDPGTGVVESLMKQAGSGASVCVSEDSAVTPMVLAAQLGSEVNAAGGFLGRSQPPATAGLAELADQADGTSQIFISAGTSYLASGVLLG